MALAITPQQLATAQSYAAAGNYQEGWNYLASIGDNYADDAYAVTTGNAQNIRQAMMYGMVRDYWDTVAGPGAYAEKFDSVSQQHFKQYVKEIADNGGILPNTEQIEASYRKSVVNNELPPKTAIDGALNKAREILPFLPHWSDILGMEDKRKVSSGIFDDLDPWESLADLVESVLKKLPQPFDPYCIAPTCNGSYLDSRTFRIDPLALDLDNDGLETVGINGYNTVLFDHNSDGIKTGTGWVTGDDALLVLDRNGNGVIDSGQELFGIDTVLSNGQKAANGFAALADLDSNSDGFFSVLDTLFNQLRLWRDLNQDGISQADELIALTDAGIANINLSYTTTNTNVGGNNIQSASAVFTRADGTSGTVSNVNLADNGFYREFTDPITLTDAAKTLPGMNGSGMVRDLREAASLNGQLVTDVNGLSNLSRPQMLDALDSLIDHWAGTSTMQTSLQQAADKIPASAPSAPYK
jgi:hypothetical protein